MIRSLGLLVYFFMAQIISCVGAFTYKSFTDYEWLDRVYNAASIGGILSTEYIGLLNEALYPALLMSDMIIILPFLLKRKEKICRKISTGSTLYFICLGIVLNFVVSVVVNMIPTKNYDRLMSVVLTGNPIMVILVSGIFAPIVEEIIFRYKIIDVLENIYNPKVALFLSSFLFGVAHMNRVQSLYAFIFGIVLGKIYQKEHNLLPSIIVHITVNAGSVLYEYSSDVVRFILLSGVLLSVFILLKYKNKNIYV